MWQLKIGGVIWLGKGAGKIKDPHGLTSTACKVMRPQLKKRNSESQRCMENKDKVYGKMDKGKTGFQRAGYTRQIRCILAACLEISRVPEYVSYMSQYNMQSTANLSSLYKEIVFSSKEEECKPNPKV